MVMVMVASAENANLSEEEGMREAVNKKGLSPIVTKAERRGPRPTRASAASGAAAPASLPNSQKLGDKGRFCN